MRTFWIVTGSILALILLTWVYFNWDKVKNFFTASTPPIVSSEPSVYDKCIEENKKKSEGASCIVCVEKSLVQRQGFNGTIQNGICVEAVVNSNTPAQTFKIKVSNPNGARVYEIQGTNFISKINSPAIPKDTEIVSKALITSPATYYQIAQNEWLSANDVKLV